LNGKSYLFAREILLNFLLTLFNLILIYSTVHFREGEYTLTVAILTVSVYKLEKNEHKYTTLIEGGYGRCLSV
jgi:hypothetical protein